MREDSNKAMGCEEGVKTPGAELLPYQREFIEFTLEYEVLGFAEYKLKSGRLSPYFFNAGTVSHD